MTTGTLVELAGIVLKNNYFQLLNKTFKQKWSSATGTKFAPPYSILFVTDLEKRLLSDIDLKSYIWWRDIDDMFLIWKHGEESLKLFLEKINSIYPTITFTANWTYSSINFVDVKVSYNEGWKDYYKFVCKSYRHSSILRLFIMPHISLQEKYPFQPNSAS